MPAVERWRFRTILDAEWGGPWKRTFTITVPEIYVFEMNPNAMTSPFPRRRLSVQTTTHVDGQPLVSEGTPEPKEWQFSGTILSKAQYDAFNQWKAKRERIWVYDHFRRRHMVTLLQMDISPTNVRSGVGTFPWRHSYTVQALVFKTQVETVYGNSTYVDYAA